jgi:hypothetical protein
VYIAESSPVIVVPGRDTRLRGRLLLAATEAAPTFTGVTFELLAAGAVVAGPYAAVIEGSGPWYGYTVPGAATAALVPGDGYGVLERWTPSAAPPVIVRRLARVVAFEVLPSVTSEELTEDYPDLAAALRTSVSDLRKDLARAWERLREDLESAGIDVYKLADPRSLATLHKLKAARLRYAKFGATNADEGATSRAAELAEEYGEVMRRAFRIDADNSGTENTFKEAPGMLSVNRPYRPGRSG